MSNIIVQISLIVIAVLFMFTAWSCVTAYNKNNQPMLALGTLITSIAALTLAFIAGWLS